MELLQSYFFFFMPNDCDEKLQEQECAPKKAGRKEARLRSLHFATRTTTTTKGGAPAVVAFRDAHGDSAHQG
jgi:hypothetical protein